MSSALEFNVRMTRKQAYDEYQTHGFEVDLVGARRDRPILATVKLFFGSRGVVADHVIGNKMRLYVGGFSTATSETAIRAWADEQQGGGSPVWIYDARNVVETVHTAAESKQYRDSPVLATLKVLDATRSLRPRQPES